jgi:hypothetical protein
MKVFAWIVCVALLASPLYGGNPPESKSNAAFDRMKSLEGTWEGSGPKGMNVRVSYKVVSAGSAVLETIDHSGMEGAMVSVYHLDGDKLMMTHYCSAGNQPSMRMTKSSPASIAFAMFDVTNLASKDDLYMNNLVVTWADKDHITEEWTSHAKGKDSPPHVFKLERKN